MDKQNTAGIYKQDESKYLSFLFCSMFFLPIITGYINEILSLSGKSTISNLTYAVVYLFGFYVLFVAIFQNFKKTLTVFAIVCIAIFLQLLLYPDVHAVFKLSGSVLEIAQSKFFQFIVLSLSILFISMCLTGESMQWIRYYCEKYSYAVGIAYIITMILQFGAKNVSVYMTIAYEAMPSILIIMYMAFIGKKKKALYMFIICAALIFIGGCRGALLQLCISAIIFFFINEEPILSPKKFAILTVGIIVAFFVYLKFNQILMLIGNYLEAHNFSSRTVRMLLGSSGEGDIFHFDDRLEVYRMSIAATSTSGSGIFVYPSGIYYPHNIVLEFLLGYGYIIGIVLLLLLLFVIFKSYRAIRRTGNQFELLLWISAFTTIFVKLMVSASYLTDRAFWFYLSLMLYSIRTGGERANDKKLS